MFISRKRFNEEIQKAAEKMEKENRERDMQGKIIADIYNLRADLEKLTYRVDILEHPEKQ